jgi:hypothetical protein
LYKFPKPLYIQKSKFYSEIILLSFRPIRPFGPATAHSFFSFQPAAPPRPTGPQPLGRPSQPTRRWRPARLPPPQQEDASSRAAIALSLRPADRWTPPVTLTSGPPELGRAATTSCRSLRRPALPQMPHDLLPPRHHFPLLNPPINLAPAINGVNAINATVTPPGHPSPVLPRPL